MTTLPDDRDRPPRIEYEGWQATSPLFPAPPTAEQVRAFWDAPAPPPSPHPVQARTILPAR
jgi:hypothetical protein